MCPIPKPHLHPWKECVCQVFKALPQHGAVWRADDETAVFRSTAVGGDDAGAAPTLVVAQKTRSPPPPSKRTRLEVLVKESVGGADEVVLVAGVSRLATHTTVSPGMSLYQMPRYNLVGVELEGAKKPKAKAPPSETMVEPGESGFPGTSRSSDALNGRMIRRINTAVPVPAKHGRACQSTSR